MTFTDEILQTPSYGWRDTKGLFLKPTINQFFKETFSRINIFKTRKNRFSLIGGAMTTCMLSFWRLITQNLVIETFPEGIYVFSHQVHHVKSDEHSDPYNPMCGFMCCILSDVNQQRISKDLSHEKYQRVRSFLIRR
jgi:stearoyl-CoA desaturase (delta-9 desaturase)